MNNQLTITINGKGGVGKSMFTIHFLDYLDERGIKHLAVDTDNENSTLSRFYPGAEFADLEDKRGLDTIFARLEEKRFIVVDARAASTEIFLGYFEELDIFDILKHFHTRLTFVCPINHEPDSIEQVRALIEEIGARASYVIVKNQSHSEHFEMWEASKTRQRVRELGGQEITMPKIYDWLVTEMNRQNMSASKALRSDAFNILECQRLKNWKKRFDAEVESVLYLLTPQ